MEVGAWPYLRETGQLELGGPDEGSDEAEGLRT